MLNPEKLLEVTDDIENTFYDLETKILQGIGLSLKDLDYNHRGATEFRNYLEKNITTFYNKMTYEIDKTIASSKIDIRNLMKELIDESLSLDNYVYEAAFKDGLIDSYNYNPIELKKIRDKGIKDTLLKLTGNTRLFRNNANVLFSGLALTAYSEVWSGAFSSSQAIENAIRQLAKSDIGKIHFKSGANRNFDTAIRTVLRTNINQTALRCQDFNFNEMGGNLVQVTSHLGARKEHALWQGQIYWRNHKEKKYKNFETSTKYMQVDGLGGVNCRHSFFPFFDGLSTDTYDKINLENNSEIYELTQEQRYYERKIREWARRKDIKDTCGYPSNLETDKLKHWKKKNEELIKANPILKRDLFKEKYHWSGVKVRRLNLDLDAMDFSKKTLQIKGPDNNTYGISYKRLPNAKHQMYAELDYKVDSASYKYISSILDEVTAMGEKLDCKIFLVNYSRLGINANASYSIEENAIFINTGVFKNSKTIAKALENGYFASDEAKGIILHELGHKKYYELVDRLDQMGYDTFEKQLKEFTLGRKHIIEKMLSEYAYVSSTERKASEVYAEYYSIKSHKINELINFIRMIERSVKK